MLFDLFFNSKAPNFIQTIFFPPHTANRMHCQSSTYPVATIQSLPANSKRIHVKTKNKENLLGWLIDWFNKGLLKVKLLKESLHKESLVICPLHEPSISWLLALYQPQWTSQVSKKFCSTPFRKSEAAWWLPVMFVAFLQWRPNALVAVVVTRLPSRYPEFWKILEILWSPETSQDLPNTTIYQEQWQLTPLANNHLKYSKMPWKKWSSAQGRMVSELLAA